MIWLPVQFQTSNWNFLLHSKYIWVVVAAFPHPCLSFSSLLFFVTLSWIIEMFMTQRHYKGKCANLNAKTRLAVSLFYSADNNRSVFSCSPLASIYYPHKCLRVKSVMTQWAQIFLLCKFVVAGYSISGMIKQKKRDDHDPTLRKR